ncbi:hypothetical protein [Flavobacterium covae]|uniref:hypothetical protein n=1 Tax=Flavobacterium covae TaxID=2906076 RepID=UPI000B095D32|nr:hypothetical protein [Flavobacterium covae]MCJ1808888.1 hypothetical protein [Flavobacterium covae]
MKNILIHPTYKNQIAKEFKVTKQTVDMSLKYVFKSETSQRIRKRAKKLLEIEAKKIK